MTSHCARKTRSLLLPALVAAAVLAGGCGTDSGTKRPSTSDPAEEAESPNAAEVRENPYSIICRRHERTESGNSEKICMTARQWQRAADDSAHSTDRAQRTASGAQGDQTDQMGPLKEKAGDR